MELRAFVNGNWKCKQRSNKNLELGYLHFAGQNLQFLEFGRGSLQAWSVDTR